MTNEQILKELERIRVMIGDHKSESLVDNVISDNFKKMNDLLDSIDKDIEDCYKILDRNKR